MRQKFHYTHDLDNSVKDKPFHLQLAVAKFNKIVMGNQDKVAKLN